MHLLTMSTPLKEGVGGGGGGGRCLIIPTETLNLDTLISQICANAMKLNDLGS